MEGYQSLPIGDGSKVQIKAFSSLRTGDFLYCGVVFYHDCWTSMKRSGGTFVALFLLIKLMTTKQNTTAFSDPNLFHRTYKHSPKLLHDRFTYCRDLSSIFYFTRMQFDSKHVSIDMMQLN